MQKITDFSYTVLFKKKKKLQYINKPKHNEIMICIKIWNYYKYKWNICVYVIVKKKNVIKNMIQLLSLINYMNLKYVIMGVYVCVSCNIISIYLTNRSVTFTYDSINYISILCLKKVLPSIVCMCCCCDCIHRYLL